jgi:hypothetical protein
MIQGEKKISILLMPELDLSATSQNTNNAKKIAGRRYLTSVSTQTAFKIYM